MRNLSLLLLALLISGCTTVVKPETKINASLLQPCPKLEKLEGTNGKIIIKWALETVNTYNECKLKHDSLVEAVKVTGEK
jgi:hypothetical protein